MLLSPKQTEFVQQATHRWNFKGGATRSGKTYLDFKWVIPARIRERAGLDGLTVLLGVTKSTIERNVLEPMRNIYGNALVGTISNDNTVWLFGEKCYALGAEKVSQVSKLRGSSIKYCYGDEVADWSEEVFELLKSRLDKAYSTFDGTYNPQYPTHWLKRFLDGNADIFSQCYCIDDNPFLPPEFISNLKKEYLGTVFYDRYILGLWVKAEGLVYPMFNESIHVIPEAKMPHNQKQKAHVQPYEKYYISADYGTKNPCVFILWGLRGGVFYAIDEYYYSGRESMPKTDDEHYEGLKALAGKLSITKVIIDPSAASFITLMQRKREFSVIAADNAVIDGIRECGTAIKLGLLKFSSKCKRTIEEFGMYSWDEKKSEDAVVKEYDHAMDATRYLVKTLRIAVPRRKKDND